MMAKLVFPPNRIDLEDQGFNFRTIRFFEELGAFSSDVVDGESSLISLLLTAVGQLKAEIYELKKQVSDNSNRDI